MNPFNDSQQIKTLLWLKCNQLRREELSTVTLQNLVDYLFLCLWKNHLPSNLNDITTDIMGIHAEDFVIFLSQQAIIEGKKRHLNEFSDLLQ